ncbi:DUF937 domain-containing protein [Sphingobacterium bovistauri]|uniref:DUF937 domain-containing protein n=1 Tax=Sphingobacterium bovistauri TaxID=2781959 RepID=A0ABS7Z9R3_9SPHI|nr:DUF937 domain-containing protein [Sphingobacterium bovistauri]MCA5006312.1 DUF937 domain-containing protein [Sphingobacterium bovistauri]
MNITDLITGGIGSKAISTIAKTLNIDESRAKWIVAAAVPLMIAALNYNSKKSAEKEEGINKALEQHGNSSILDQLGGILGQGPTDDDNKIVNHMFGRNTELVTNSLAEKTGISTSQIGGVLATLAPIVMGYLGNQKQQSSGGGIGDLIGSVLGGGQSNSSAGGGILGSILGSVLGGGGGSNQPTSQGDLGGLADLAGDFFNQGNDNNKKGSILDSLAGIFGK